jgi:hypothetical protein
MSLATLFDSGNRGNRPNSDSVTATGHATQGGNRGNRGNRENKSINFKNLIVTCYTPYGDPIEIRAKDHEHAKWLVKMNPKPNGGVGL